MKKVFLSMLAIAIAAFTFTSCDDVPMPYDMPSSGGNGGNNYGTPSGEGTAADPFNVAAALSYIAAGEDLDQEVYVKGIIVSIDEVNTSFGNATFNISDDGTNTNVLKVYRSKGLNNQNIKSEDEISVGNEVVIVGKLVNYNGTYEFTQGCYIYSLNGSGGGGTGEATGDGTLANPYNSVAAANYAKSLGSDVNSPKDVYIKGKVVSIAVDKNGVAQNFDNGTYGNASFYISDDGTENGQFYVFRTLYLGNKQWVQGAGDIVKVGDEVIICGKVVNYKGNTPETVQKESYLYSLNGNTGGGTTPTPTGEATGDGTLANPYNSVAAANYAQSLGSDVNSPKDVYIKGKVVSIAVDKNGVAQNFDNGTYGNASFYISDDGTENGQFYVFRTLYLGNKQWVQGAGDLVKVGDEVIICGKVVNYKGNTPETVQKESYLYSLNGNTGDNSGTGTTTDAGSYASPITVTQAIALANADQAWVRGYIVGFVDGRVYTDGCKFSADGASQTNILIAASASETDPAKCMPVQLPTGDLRTKLNLADNPSLLKQSVLLCGQLTAYFSVPGIKSPVYAEVGSQQIGTRPSAAKRR